MSAITIDFLQDFNRGQRPRGADAIAVIAGRCQTRTSAAHQRVFDEFAIIAKKCRKRRRLSIEAVAQRSEISAKRIKQFERGVAAASESEIRRLAAVYGVSTSVITRRLQHVFAQVARSDVGATGSLLQLKWGPETRVAAGQRAAQALRVRDLPGGAAAIWASSLLPECFQLRTVTRCIQDVVEHVSDPGPVQPTEVGPQPNRDGTTSTALRMTGSDESLAFAIANLRGMVDRLETLCPRPIHSGAGVVSENALEIGDVTSFLDQGIHAERARIVDIIDLLSAAACNLLELSRSCA